MLQYQFRPLEAWPGEKTKRRKSHYNFKADWASTLDLLERELRQINAREIVIQVALDARFIRNDGMIRADARSTGPEVILSFATPKLGDMMYPCDAFDDWQANVRAIALALEALRKVDRYGVTRRSEQYQGWAKLPGPILAGQRMQPDEARQVLNAAAGLNGQPVTAANYLDVYRRACAKTHPDQGGSADTFKRVQEAKQSLDSHFGT